MVAKLDASESAVDEPVPLRGTDPGGNEPMLARAALVSWLLKLWCWKVLGGV